MAEGDKGTSAILETAACSDRAGGFVVTAYTFTLFINVNEILHLNNWTNGLIIKR